ncbi:hypothetical protein B0O41_3107 [Propionibacteriaceae bacterium ES.041]|uniref:hypothetical protein n=1 Tax=Enemella evansiae TaxID=2016499 RepID=UPI000C00A6B9|nr:hypothetical protein [Enemella evansiae]PFG68273.1 hypothetical protein B0O41_3107 [Propionibacteriaceae bacterium ES.041]TDO86393.1 hypothetical protein C8D81_3771 [Enemella evansiae]
MAGTGFRGRVTAGLAAAAVVVAMGLGGCANSPSTAATVGDRTITTSEVADTSRELTAINPKIAEPALVLSVKMRAAAAEQIAQSRNINLDTETQALLPQLQIPPELMANPAGNQLVRDLVKVDALGQKLGQGELAAAMGFIPVTVNPRYGLQGLEDVANDQQAIGSGSLSQPAAR